MKRLKYIIAIVAISIVGATSCKKEETIKMERVDIVDAVFASGQIISEYEYQVTSKAEGYLTGFNISEGTPVEKGNLLFSISKVTQDAQLKNSEASYADAKRKTLPNSPEQVKLQLQIEQAKFQLESDKKNLARYENLLEVKAVSQADYDRIKLQYENSKRNLSIQQKGLEDLIKNLELSLLNANTQLITQQESSADYEIRSELNGEVLQLLKEPGELVRRGEVMALLGGGEKIIKLFIAEEDINQVELGQLIYISLNTSKDELYEASISKIYPSFDQLEQSFIIEAKFKTLPEKLYHNTQVQGNILIAERTTAFAIPTAYLIGGDSVKTSEGNKKVMLGLQNKKWTEILGGISESTQLYKPDLE